MDHYYAWHCLGRLYRIATDCTAWHSVRGRGSRCGCPERTARISCFAAITHQTNRSRISEAHWQETTDTGNGQDFSGLRCRSHRRPLDDRPCHFGFAWQGRCWRKGEAPDRSCSLHGVFIPKPLAALVGIRLSREQLLRLLAAERLTRRAVQSAPQNYSLALAGGWSRTAGGSEGAIGARADQTHSGTHPSSPVISAFC